MAENSFVDTFQNRKQARLESGESDRLTLRSYNLVITAVLAYGLLLNAVIVSAFAPQIAAFFAGVSPWMWLLAYLVPTIVGVIMAARSANPFVSFVGYNLVVIPIGLLLALVIPGVSPAVVSKAMLLTAMVTATMMVLAVVHPRVFLGMGRTLFIARE